MVSDAIVILGASVRAAAFSALRAGMVPCAADLFADIDLERCAAARAVTDYPDGLAAAARQFPPGPWMYTGGLENHASLVERIAAERLLAGNGGSTLRRVRDPHRLGETLRAAGLAAPPTACTAVGLPHDGTWLAKPLRASGGMGIEPWRGPQPGRAGPPPAGCYFQQQVAGEPHAAAYVAAQGESRLLGITRQLVGTEWVAAKPYHYAGSIGPLRCDSRLREQFEAIGRRLARQFGLVGLFGVDAVVDGGTVWTIEVNPRYTASMEVLERAGRFSAVGMHLAACRSGALPEAAAASSPTCWGKAVLYARRDRRIGTAFAAFAERAMEAGFDAELADIPRRGADIAAGRPVATVLAAGAEPGAVLAALCRRAAAIESLTEAL
jgi:predicted ATP-grasp superfamily ATP-dependent carboligase